MSQPVYQKGSEPVWWWRVAKHLDDAQLSSVNAMAHNLDDQTLVFALQDKMREAQVILLEIFRSKGLLPAVNGAAEGVKAPMPEAEIAPPFPGVEEISIFAPSPEIAEKAEEIAGVVIQDGASPDPDAPKADV
jgi:hypothetical protein